ncbi:hypothetical protein SPRG_00297 [Saprolegnia parasitica CBS 223.65]|uniref:PX domain-containing protein n=1 Tax=Saprolegnia parasitica (strain CBS 223.65) TaxID=695850 RepID=A0A067CXK8_SAPPC|nr:hypothetical protein SPRG_00297 [Saprolegnia parasitica CBS 223.65]KDO35449.1 hypothetical protein SPRG_00297 [Saprolegnia parasitica CBS 223.65]|eukprot:XP_012193789.1 hypothetical protein SPRG_00297 [Saprolegnia parasitica CBS 223.65]
MAVFVESISPIQAKVVAVGVLHSVTVYVIRVHHGDDVWYIARRYSEFHELMKTIQAVSATTVCDVATHFQTFGIIESFPKKKLFNTRSLALSRLEELQEFLKTILMATQGLTSDIDEACSMAHGVRAFLEAPASATTSPSHSAKRDTNARIFGQLSAIYKNEEELDESNNVVRQSHLRSKSARNLRDSIDATRDSSYYRSMSVDLQG